MLKYVCVGMLEGLGELKKFEVYDVYSCASMFQLLQWILDAFQPLQWILDALPCSYRCFKQSSHAYLIGGVFDM